SRISGIPYGRARRQRGNFRVVEQWNLLRSGHEFAFLHGDLEAVAGRREEHRQIPQRGHHAWRRRNRPPARRIHFAGAAGLEGSGFGQRSAIQRVRVAMRRTLLAFFALAFMAYWFWTSEFSTDREASVQPLLPAFVRSLPTLNKSGAPPERPTPPADHGA